MVPTRLRRRVPFDPMNYPVTYGYLKQVLADIDAQLKVLYENDVNLAKQTEAHIKALLNAMQRGEIPPEAAVAQMHAVVEDAGQKAVEKVAAKVAKESPVTAQPVAPVLGAPTVPAVKIYTPGGEVKEVTPDPISGAVYSAVKGLKDTIRKVF